MYLKPKHVVAVVVAIIFATPGADVSFADAFDTVFTATRLFSALVAADAALLSDTHVLTADLAHVCFAVGTEVSFTVDTPDESAVSTSVQQTKIVGTLWAATIAISAQIPEAL